MSAPTPAWRRAAVAVLLVLLPRLSPGEPPPISPKPPMEAHLRLVCGSVANFAETAVAARDRGMALDLVLGTLVPPRNTPPGSALPFILEVSRPVALVVYRDSTLTTAAARAYGERECRRRFPAYLTAYRARQAR